jgi:glycine oxidase
LISADYKIINHLAGIRPTTKDRQPLVGKHWNLDNTYLLNGLGTRGVLFSAFLAKKLYNLIENQIALPKEIDVNRIYNKMKKQGMI